jgi:glyoxylase-like metal-dependent hydrolase (beta-lactamase superfamily II)
MSHQQTSRSRGPHSPDVTGFYEPDTGSVQYVVSCPSTKRAAIVDAVWNFDPKRARTDMKSANEILTYVKEQGLSADWVLDTHPHADHFTAAAHLKERFGCPQAIGTKVREVAVRGGVNFITSRRRSTSTWRSIVCFPTAIFSRLACCLSVSCCRPATRLPRSPM